MYALLMVFSTFFAFTVPVFQAPPIMASEARKKLQIDAQNWLQSTINKIALDTGSQRSLHADQAG